VKRGGRQGFRNPVEKGRVGFRGDLVEDQQHNGVEERYPFLKRKTWHLLKTLNGSMPGTTGSEHILENP